MAQDPVPQPTTPPAQDPPAASKIPATKNNTASVVTTPDPPKVAVDKSLFKTYDNSVEQLNGLRQSKKVNDWSNAFGHIPFNAEADKVDKIKISEAEGVEKVAHSKALGEIEKLISPYVTKDIVNTADYSTTDQNGHKIANSKSYLNLANVLSNSVGGGVHTKNLIHIELMKRANDLLASERYGKYRQEVIGSGNYKYFKLDEKTGDAIPLMAENFNKAALNIESTYKANVDAIRRSTNLNARTEIKQLKTKYDPQFGAIAKEYQQKYKQLSEGIANDLNKQMSLDYDNKFNTYQQMVKEGQMTVDDANKELAALKDQYTSNFNDQVKKLSDAEFEKQFRQEYQSKWNAVNDQMVGEVTKVNSKYKSILNSQAKGEYNRYVNAFNEAKSKMDNDSKAEWNDINRKVSERAEGSQKISLAIAKAKRAFRSLTNVMYEPINIEVLAKDFIANSGNMLNGWGYYLDNVGLGGGLSDWMKGQGQLTFDQNKVYQAPLTMSNAVDPESLAAAGGQMAYSMPAIAAGVLTGGAGAAPAMATAISATAATLSNASMMYGDTYKQALEKGMSVSEAQNAAANMYKLDLALWPAEYLMSNMLFGVKSKSFVKRLADVGLGTGAEGFQEMSEAAGQNILTDPTKKETIKSQLTNPQVWEEGKMAGQSALMMGLLGLTRGSGKKKSVSAPDVQHALHMAEDSGNDTKSQMHVERAMIEGDLDPAQAMQIKQRHADAVYMWNEARRSGMSPTQAKLFVAKIIEAEEARQQAGDIKSKVLQDAKNNEAAQLEQEAKDISDGLVSVVTLDMGVTSIVVTEDQAKEILQNADMAEAVSNGDVEITADNEELVVALMDMVNTMSDNPAAPVINVEVQQDVVNADNTNDTTQVDNSNIAITDQTQNDGEIQRQEEGRQDVLTQPSTEQTTAQQPVVNETQDNNISSIVNASGTEKEQAADVVGKGRTGVKYEDIIVGDKRLEDILDEYGLSESEKNIIREAFSRGVRYFEFDKESSQKFNEKFANPEDIQDVSDILVAVASQKESDFAAYNDRNYQNVIDAINYIVSNPSEYSDNTVKAASEIKQKLDNPTSSFNRLYAFDVMKELNIAESNSIQQSAQVAPVTIEQYVPITVKEISHDKFTRDNAIDYEEGEREDDNGRTRRYLASITVEVMNNDGDTVGSLTKITDEDGTVNWQATDVDGNELSKDTFDTKDEAKQALVDRWNKVQKKEFDKEAKKKAKAAEKEAAKKAKAEAKAKPVAATPVTTTQEVAPVSQVMEPAAVVNTASQTTSVLEDAPQQAADPQARKSFMEKAYNDLGIVFTALKTREGKIKKLNAVLDRVRTALNDKVIGQDDFDELYDRISKNFTSLGEEAPAATEDKYMNEIRKEIEAQLKAEETGEAAPETKPQEKSKLKAAAAAVRKHRDNVGKNTLYDSVLGLPVAIYKGLLTTVALALEAGDTVKQAAEKGLQYLKNNYPVNDKGKENKFSIQGVYKEMANAIAAKTGSQGTTLTTKERRSLVALAKASFKAGKDMASVINEIQNQIKDYIKLYGTTFSKSGINNLLDTIINELGTDFTASDVVSWVQKVDDLINIELNRQKVSQARSIQKKLKALANKNPLTKESYQNLINDVIRKMPNPSKVLTHLGEVELDAYIGMMQALLNSFGNKQGVRTITKENIKAFAEGLANTNMAIEDAQYQRLQDKYDALDPADKQGMTFDDYVAGLALDAEQAAKEKLDNALQKSIDSIYKSVAIAQKLQRLLYQQLDEFDNAKIKEIANRLAYFDLSRLLDAPVINDEMTEEEKIKANKDANNKYVRNIAKIVDILNNMIMDQDPSEAEAFLEYNETAKDSVDALVQSGEKVRGLTKLLPTLSSPSSLWTLNNIFERLFFSKKGRTLFAEKVYQPFRSGMIKARNAFFGVDGKGGVVEEMYKTFQQNRRFIDNNSTYRIGVVNFLNQRARTTDVRTAKENFTLALRHLIDVEVIKMLEQGVSIGGKLGRSYIDRAEGVANALKSLGLIADFQLDKEKLMMGLKKGDASISISEIPDVADQFVDSNDDNLDNLFGMLNKGEANVNNYMRDKLNEANFISDLELTAKSVFGIDFRAINDYFPLRVRRFAGTAESEKMGLNIEGMTSAYNGIRNMFVRPSDRNKRRGELADESMFYEMDAFNIFLASYYEGLTQIYAAKAAKSMQYTLNDKKFQDFVNGMMNKDLGWKIDSKHVDNYKMLQDKFQEVFDDEMAPVGIYKNMASALQNGFDAVSKMMIKSWLQYSLQMVNQSAAQFMQTMIDVGPNYFVKAIQLQSNSMLSTESREVYKKFLSNFSAAHRSALGNEVFDRIDNVIQTHNWIDNINNNSLRHLTELTVEGAKLPFTMINFGAYNALSFTDAMANNNSLLAAYIKSLVQQGVIKNASDFDYDMMMEHAENPNATAMAEAENTSAEINNASNKAERASVVKSIRTKTGYNRKGRGFDTAFLYLLKSFSLQSISHMNNQMKIMFSSQASSADKTAASRSFVASVAQVATFNLAKIYVVNAAYESAAKMLFTLLYGMQPKEDDDDEAKAKKATMFYKFLFQSSLDGLTGGSNVLVEQIIKFATSFGYKEFLSHMKKQNEGEPMEFYYPDFSTFTIDKAPANQNMMPWTMDTTPAMGGLDPIADFSQDIYNAFTPSKRAKLNDLGNQRIDELQYIKLVGILLENGDILKLDQKLQKLVAEHPEFKKGGSGGSGGGFKKSFGGSGGFKRSW